MSWLTRLLGRSEAAPDAGAPAPGLESLKVEGEDERGAAGLLPAFEGLNVKAQTMPEGEFEPGLSAEPGQSRAAFDAFLSIDGIKGETEDRAAAFGHDDPDGPVILGGLPNPPGPGGPVPVPYPLTAEARSDSLPGGIGSDETLTVRGGQTESAAMPGLHKVSDVTLKRGVVGAGEDPFDVKTEGGAPAPRLSSDPEEGGEVASAGGGTVSDDVVVDGRIITGGTEPSAAETVHLYLKSNGEDIQGSAGAGDAGEQVYLKVELENARAAGGGANELATDDTAGRAGTPLGDTGTHEVGHWASADHSPQGPGAPDGLSADGEPEQLEVKLENVQITSYQLGVLDNDAATDDARATGPLGLADSGDGGGPLEAKEEIHIESFSWGTTQSGAHSTEEPLVADSFSFGVEREMKESGEKGGTEDAHIGVGELQETTISKSSDGGGDFDVKIEEVVAPGSHLDAGSKETFDLGLARESSDPEEGGEFSLQGIKLARESSDPEEGGEVSGLFLGRDDGTLQPSAAEGISDPGEAGLDSLAQPDVEEDAVFKTVKLTDVMVTGFQASGSGADESSHEVGHTLGFRHEHVRPESSEGLPEEQGALDPAEADDGSIPTETLSLNFDKVMLKTSSADFEAFGGFQGGVSVAAGDIDADGIPDDDFSSTLEPLEPEGLPDIAGNFADTADGEIGDIDLDDLDLDLDDGDGDGDVEV